MVTASGIRVGIVGVMTERALSVTIAANTGGLQVAPLVDTIAAEAKRLRADGATIVVVTSHAGGRCTAFTSPTDLSSCEPDEEIMRVARALPPGLVDVIVAGHAHSAMAHMVAGVAIIESFNGGRTFGRIDLVVDRASRRVLEKRIFAPRDLCSRWRHVNCDSLNHGSLNCSSRRIDARSRAARSGAAAADSS